MEIIEERIDHILAVACKMFDLAPAHNIPREEAFVLGLIHESGIRYTEDANKKYIVGGSILGKEGYQYWREVYYALSKQAGILGHLCPRWKRNNIQCV